MEVKSVSVEAAAGELRSLESELIPPAKQDRSRKKLEDLLRIGREVIAREGYEGLRVEDVCREADCTIASFYQRFPDKITFFCVVQLRCYLSGVEIWESKGRDLIASFDTLEGVVWAFIAGGPVGQFRRNAALYREFARAGSHDPQVRRVLMAWNRFSKAEFARLLEPHLHRIEHPNPILAAEFALHLVFSYLTVIVQNSSGPLELDDTRLPGWLTDMVLRTLRVRDYDPDKTGPGNPK